MYTCVPVLDSTIMESPASVPSSVSQDAYSTKEDKTEQLAMIYDEFMSSADTDSGKASKEGG